MSTGLRRLVCAAILALCAIGASATVAEAASRLEHACCHRAPAESSAAPDVPCHGFLPLTCCKSAALPGTEHASPPPLADLAVAPAAVALPAPTAFALQVREALAPRPVPSRLSVVLQV
jgi:hypothetical protein